MRGGARDRAGAAAARGRADAGAARRGGGAATWRRAATAHRGAGAADVGQALVVAQRPGASRSRRSRARTGCSPRFWRAGPIGCPRAGFSTIPSGSRPTCSAVRRCGPPRARPGAAAGRPPLQGAEARAGPPRRPARHRPRDGARARRRRGWTGVVIAAGGRHGARPRRHGRGGGCGGPVPLGRRRAPEGLSDRGRAVGRQARRRADGRAQDAGAGRRSSTASAGRGWQAEGLALALSDGRTCRSWASPRCCRATAHLMRRIAETAAAVVGDGGPTCSSPSTARTSALRVAERVRAADPSVRIVHYVAPSVWAWRPGRAREDGARHSTRCSRCLPFEPPYLRGRGPGLRFRRPSGRGRAAGQRRRRRRPSARGRASARRRVAVVAARIAAGRGRAARARASGRRSAAVVGAAPRLRVVVPAGGAVAGAGGRSWSRAGRASRWSSTRACDAGRRRGKRAAFAGADAGARGVGHGLAGAGRRRDAAWSSAYDMAGSAAPDHRAACCASTP